MSLPEVIEPTGTELDEFLDFEVASLFPGRVGDAINALPPNYRQMSEAELMQELNPTPMDFAIRRAFWNAVEVAKKLQKKKIPAARIYENTCARVYFEEAFLSKPLKVAWMCRPIVPHEVYYEAINKVVVQKLLEYAMNNPVNEKNLVAILKLAENSANRAYGSVVQKIQTKNLNLEGRLPDAEKPPAADQQQLEARAHELQAKLLSQAKDVTPTEEN